MHSHFLTRTALASGAAMAILLAGCGGGDVTAVPSSTTLSGTAAVGAPIVGGNVSITCAAGPAVTGIPNTSAIGAWSATLSGQTLPCAVLVSGGNLGSVNGTANTNSYQSIASAYGTVNVTPLTDLLVANLAGATVPLTQTQLAAYNTAVTSLATQINSALSNLRTALNIEAFNSLNPITTSFNPASGNVMDDVLSAVRIALANASKTYADLLAAAAVHGVIAIPTGFDAAAAYASMQSGDGDPAAPGGGTVSGLTCDTTKFQSGAPVANPTAEQLSTFARTYTGSEGDTDSNTFAFVATGSATLVLNANGTATYNSAAYAPTSYCLETLSGDAGTQLVIHSGAMSHFDLKTSGAWSGYTTAGKVVTDTAYAAASGGGNASTFGALAITGNAVGIQSATVPATFNPTAYGTHPTAPISWSMASGNSTWYVTVNGDVITSTAGFGSWQKQAVLIGVESAGVSFDMPGGHITFTNVALPAFSIGQTGTMTLNGTLNVTPATGTALVITGNGTNAAGSGLDAPAASVSPIGTMNRYVWNGGKGISLQVENYSNGTNTVTVTNSAGPSWRNLSAGSTVTVNTTAKTISFNASALTGISPTTTTITLNGTLTLP
jgi:hypothetical protein